MATNPIIQRYRFCLLRPKQFWMNQVIYFGIVGLIVLINALIFLNSSKNGTKIFKSMYYQILTLEILILWFWASYNTASAIRNEVQRKTYDFFKLMPVSATRKAIGILVGTNLVVLLFGVYNLLLLIIFGVLGKVNVTLQCFIFFAILSVAILLNNLSLLSSVRIEQKQAQTSSAGLILLGLIFGPLAISGVISLSESEIVDSSIRFYVLHIPAPLMIAFTSLYFCCWSFAGIVRKFNFERRPLFSYSSALVFMVGYSVLVCGFFWAFMEEAGIPALYSLWMITLIPLLFIPFGAAKSYDMYLEGLRLSKWGGAEGNMIWRLFKNSNLFLWLSLFIVWALFSMAMGFKSGHSTPPFASSIIALFSFVLFFSLLFEIHVLYQPLYTKIKWFLGFVVLLYLLVPLILQGLLGNERLFLYSPGGYMFYLLDQAAGGKSAGFPTGVLVLNFMLCIIAIGLIWRAYNKIVAIRQRMVAS